MTTTNFANGKRTRWTRPSPQGSPLVSSGLSHCSRRWSFARRLQHACCRTGEDLSPLHSLLLGRSREFRAKGDIITLTARGMKLTELCSHAPVAALLPGGQVRALLCPSASRTELAPPLVAECTSSRGVDSHPRPSQFAHINQPRVLLPGGIAIDTEIWWQTLGCRYTRCSY